MRYLFALGLFLALITVALLVLVTFSSRSQLYQKAFVYQADLSKFGLSISTFAPISIAPTIISIIISLWWDQIDLTFRLLQPYIAMSRSPTPVSSSSGITYRSKTWIGAVIKAARHRHWILCFVAIGTTLSQVLTVSMSALFERKPHNVLSRVNLNRTLETRQMPVITTIDQTGWPFEWDDVYAATKLDKTVRWDITEPLYQNSSYNWLYNTPTKFSVNAPQMTWTQGAWSFAPVDLSSIIVPDSRSTTEKEVRKAAVVPFMNVTLRTSAIRARLDCEPIDEVADKSTWLQAMSVQLLNETLINTTMEYITLPEGLSDGYILIEKMFANTSSVTTIRRGGDEKMTKCCINGTGQSPQRAAIGYWTPVQTEGWNRTDPYPSQGKLQWPPSIVTKWIVGKPQSFKDQGNITVGPLFFEEQPVLQAARCKPIIETAEAKILIDRTTSTVHSHELLGPITGLDSAWYENHVRHDLSDPEKQYNMNYTGKLNTTTSLGILFLDGLLSASVSKEPVGDVYYAYENTGTDQFVYREEDGGLNMDLMSYTMYTLANNDPEALLNYTTLVNNANRTFQSFFQDFVNTKLAHYNDDGTGFQRIGANMKDLGQAVDYNGASLVNPLYPSLNTDRTIEAVISSRRQVLYMNPVATYLAVAIITWLIATTAVVAALQRRYTSTMLRNVELIADVLVLIAGSENFLDLVQERGPALKKDGNVKTQLGWFKGRDGEVRWGVEVVGGRNPVEWVDAPMKRFT
ncbi:hypothetical protein DM02DRAFT_115979 [Periconia macrospinosa]|uniref:Uncharacterized protein n=1 Tax=Periconia macrospinosa TaxID=97972 RepID=A0A2V1DEF9_9PLEO|nr:hypothetical protein DM02DRAFT_115979 [Periconia macrospinosa]